MKIRTANLAFNHDHWISQTLSDYTRIHAKVNGNLWSLKMEYSIQFIRIYLDGTQNVQQPAEGGKVETSQKLISSSKNKSFQGKMYGVPFKNINFIAQQLGLRLSLRTQSPFSVFLLNSLIFLPKKGGITCTQHSSINNNDYNLSTSQPPRSIFHTPQSW